MKKFLIFLLLSACAFASEKPNIIIIYSDDHGYTDIGAHGIDANVQTPYMDKLIKEGALMKSGYSTAPQCRPSRAGLISGMYQNRFGFRGNGDGDLPLNITTIADIMKKAGYATGMVGKWHLGNSSEYAPVNRGFDLYFNGSNRTVNANFDLKGNVHKSKDLKLPPLPNRCVVQGQAAESFIEINKEKPFFLYLAIFGPHVPTISKEDPYYLNFPAHDYPALSDAEDDVRRQGLGLIKAIDDAVKGVVEKLKSLKLDKKTIIFFAGDNGAQPKLWKSASRSIKGWDGSENIPLRGEKGSLWEGGVKVPMWAWGPSYIKGGTVIEEAVSALDFSATSAKLATGSVPANYDGVNLLPRLKGSVTAIDRKNPLFWDYRDEIVIRKGDWKFRRSGGPAGDLLFNLKKDPNELFDVSQMYPEKVKELLKELLAWQKTLPEKGRSPLSDKNGFTDNVYLKGAKPNVTPDERYFVNPLNDPTDKKNAPYPAPVIKVKP